MRLIRILVAAFLLLCPFTSHAAEEKSQLIMAFDMSGSMKGDGLAATKSAAKTFLNQLPEQTSLEIYTFSTQIDLIQGMSSDRVKLASAIDSIESKGETAIYDSVIALVNRAKSENAGLIIFTDGRDSASVKSAETTKTLVTESKVRIRFVAFQPRESDLQKIVDIAGIGGVIRVNQIERLSDAFKVAARSIESSPTPIVVAPMSAPQKTSRALPILFGGGAALLSVLIMSSSLSLIRRRSAIERMGDLLESYQVTNLRADFKGNARQIRSAADRFTRKLIGNYEVIFPRLGERRYLIFLGGYVAMILIGALLHLSLVLNLFAVTITAVFILRFAINGIEERKRHAFEVELPNSLKILAASLASGLSFLQALETFVRDNETQVAYEFRRALTEIQMGAAVEAALSGVASRMKNDDLDWTIFAFTIQREVGGSLAKILETSAITIESRAELRREVRTLSAEGRLSSYILMFLPIGIFTFLFITRRSSISIFWTEGVGRMMFATVIIFMVLAWVWIRKLVKISA